MKNQSVTSNIDWISVFFYTALVVMGWMNIYSSSLSMVGENSIFDFSQVYAKQLMFIVFTIPLIFVILALDGKFYEKFASIIFVASLLSIAGLFVFGSTVKGKPTGIRLVRSASSHRNSRKPQHRWHWQNISVTFRST